MKLLRLYTLTLFLTTAIFADEQPEQMLDTTGNAAIEDLETLLGNQGAPKEDGIHYTVNNIFNLPTRVKPGAVVKIKKSTHNKDDPYTTITIEKIEDMGTTTYSLSEDEDYFVINFPKQSNLEYEIMMDMRTTSEKYEIYKYWVYSHTFEVEQPNEGWIF